MKKRLHILEITDDTVIKKWGNDIMNTYYKTAQDTLKEEGVSEEILFYFEANNRKYIAFYMVGHTFLPSNKDKEINRKHVEIIQSIKKDDFIEAEKLYDVTA